MAIVTATTTEVAVEGMGITPKILPGTAGEERARADPNFSPQTGTPTHRVQPGRDSSSTSDAKYRNSASKCRIWNGVLSSVFPVETRV